MNQEHQALQEKLQEELGDAVEVLAAQAIDSVDGVLPQVVAAPREEASARALVSWCGRENVALIPRGGATKIEVGARPAKLDLILSTRHLNEVFDHDEGNATVTAGAGIMLSRLDNVVGERGQFVPLDYAEGSTLGGAVAANEAGATKMKYGAPRDLVVGLRAALSDGRSMQIDSKVVKNVSGYDMSKLFVGSFGSLGLITRITLRLRPRDETTQWWNAQFSSWHDAEAAALRIVDGAFEPTVLQLLSTPQNIQLRARFDGVEAAVQTQIARLESSASQEKDVEVSAPDHAVRLRAALPLRPAADWAAEAQKVGAVFNVWDCATGFVRAYFSEIPDIADLRQKAEKSGGNMIVERAPHELKTPELVWGTSRSESFLLQRLKDKFDAANAFSAGRFTGVR